MGSYFSKDLKVEITLLISAKISNLKITPEGVQENLMLQKFNLLLVINCDFIDEFSSFTSRADVACSRGI